MEIIKFKEDVIYDNIADQIIKLCESGKFDEVNAYMNKLTEKALFGSMKSQKKKLIKKINDLKIKISKLGNLNNPKAAELFKNFAVNCQKVESVLNSPVCDAVFNAIDDNTGWFGRDKGKFGSKSGITSTKFQISENKEADLNSLNEDESLTTDNVEQEKTSNVETSHTSDEWDNLSESDLIKAWFSARLIPVLQDFTSSVKSLEEYGVKSGHPILKQIAAYAGPILMAGSMLVSFIPGGQAVALGMRAVGGACTAVNSSVGVANNLAKGNYVGAAMNAGGAIAGGLVAANGLTGLHNMYNTVNTTPAVVNPTTAETSVNSTVPTNPTTAAENINSTKAVSTTSAPQLKDTIVNTVDAQAKAHIGDVVNGKVLTANDIKAAQNQLAYNARNGLQGWNKGQFLNGQPIMQNAVVDKPIPITPKPITPKPIMPKSIFNPFQQTTLV